MAGEVVLGLGPAARGALDEHAMTYSLLAMAVSVPLIMSRVACTMRSLYSSGMPMISQSTHIGRCSANWLTRSASPSSQNALTSRWVARLM